MAGINLIGNRRKSVYPLERVYKVVCRIRLSRSKIGVGADFCVSRHSRSRISFIGQPVLILINIKCIGRRADSGNGSGSNQGQRQCEHRNGFILDLAFLLAHNLIPFVN